MSAKNEKLYGFSVYFLPQDGLGRRVSGAPQAVREFTVTSDTGDTLVLNDQWSVDKKGMKLDLGAFQVPLDRTVQGVRARSEATLGL
ncbi:hypothetical protein [Paraburkholderia youngii]|uniref:hypothetical protein n=1 Tax=Paraburkholderia youngii TaxID=2782701 RepID=UPI003D260BD8